MLNTQTRLAFRRIVTGLLYNPCCNGGFEISCAAVGLVVSRWRETQFLQLAVLVALQISCSPAAILLTMLLSLTTPITPSPSCSGLVCRALHTLHSSVDLHSVMRLIPTSYIHRKQLQHFLAPTWPGALILLPCASLPVNIRERDSNAEAS